jgi:glycosyltransferase involved in cell wall biosynthesis
MNHYSVIIPSYNQPDYLNLCLKSCFESFEGTRHEIVVVLDGHSELYHNVVSEWEQYVKFIVLEENMGLAYATNIGVLNSKHDNIVIVNDDNLFPMGWDSILDQTFRKGILLVPNQIEPKPSIFKQFKICPELDIEPNKFDLNSWFDWEFDLRENKIDDNGWTLPIVIHKSDYWMVGGWDTQYDSPHVVDWDFFYKLKLAGLKSVRTYKCNFYHFGSKSARTPDSYQKEEHAHAFFAKKWGAYCFSDPITNEKSLMK